MSALPDAATADAPDRRTLAHAGVADAGVADPVAGLLWAAPGRRPRHVFVAGEPVVVGRRLARVDEHDVADALTALLAARAA